MILADRYNKGSLTLLLSVVVVASKTVALKQINRSVPEVAHKFALTLCMSS